MKLATRIIAVSLSTVVALTMVASYFTNRNAYEEFEYQHREVAKWVSVTLSELLIEAWNTSGPAGLARLLRERGPTRNIVLGVNFVPYDDKAPAGFRPLLRRELWPVGPGQEPVSDVVADVRGNRQLLTSVPLAIAPGVLGGLEYRASLEPIERQTRHTVWQALITIGSLALISVLVAYSTGILWIARPLEALIEKTKHIGRGDLSSPLTCIGRDELRELAIAVEEMCGQLSAQQSAIRAEVAQRMAALEQLRHADRLKTVGRLAAGIAHELGTPLNVVSGRAALIASGKLNETDVQASARTIKSEADRITGIVGQLLALARRRTPQRSVTDLKALVGRTMDLLKPLAVKQNVEMVIAPDSTAVQAPIDAGQIQQVLTNILVNAVQAMPAGGRVDVRLSELQDSATAATPGEIAQSSQLAKPGRWAQIEISDTGTGIDAEHLEHIFEPFFTTKDVGEGTGLGLSIAFGIVQEHGGRIDVSSTPGKGSRFTILLPMETAE